MHFKMPLCVTRHYRSGVRALWGYETRNQRVGGRKCGGISALAVGGRRKEHGKSTQEHVHSSQQPTTSQHKRHGHGYFSVQDSLDLHLRHRQSLGRLVPLPESLQ